jgi:hypothetical protein
MPIMGKGLPRPQDLGAGARPTEPEQRPYVKRPTRSVGVYLLMMPSPRVRWDHVQGIKWDLVGPIRAIASVGW